MTQRVYDFIKRIQAMTTVERRIIHPSGRNENDAEHSWHLAMMVWILAPYYEKKIDVARAIKMALMHDLVELVVGDTPFFADQTGKKDRELQAAHQLFEPLPKDLRDELLSLWHEFEEDKMAEAQFVKALDKLQPVLVNLMAEGRAWKEYEVSEAIVRSHKEDVRTRGSVLRDLFDWMLDEGRKGKMFWDGEA